MKFKKIVIASGKGGVGKTLVASSFALMEKKNNRTIGVDCDADAPNFNLWLGVKDWEKSIPVSTSEKAEINPDKCISCGKCFSACRFGAIVKPDAPGKPYKVNPLLCEGCGSCALVCSESAPKLSFVQNGVVNFKLNNTSIELVSGSLLPGERCSGKIVTEVRKEAEKLKHERMFLDSAAGTGCTVNASVLNSDYAVLVTEPTPSGFSDLKRVLSVVKHFSVPYGIIVNRWDINKEFSKKIERFAGKKLLGRIPYDREVVDSLVNLEPVINKDCKASIAIKKIYLKLSKLRT